MPELPEVETVRRGLDRLIVEKKIMSVDFDWPGSTIGEVVHYCGEQDCDHKSHFSRRRMQDTFSQKNEPSGRSTIPLDKQKTHQYYSKSFPNAPADVKKFLIGASVTEVRRRAKVLIIDLDTDYSLVVHLKMTGQMVFRGQEAFGAGHPNDSMIGKLPDKSTRVTIGFTDDSALYFNDQRKFGWMRLLPTVEVPNIDFMKKVGPEPLSPEFTSKIFIQRVKKRAGSTIKAAILDQTVLAGVGNIYADEALWGAKIHPASRVRAVPDHALKKLHTEIVYVLALSIDKGGSTDKNYVDAEGKKGSYLSFARVFRREGLDCPRHAGTAIIKLRVAGRGTHICPKCQKEMI